MGPNPQKNLNIFIHSAAWLYFLHWVSLVLPCAFPLPVKVKVAQLCPALCDPMDYTVHGILHARILEWAAFPFSRGSSRDWTQVSRIAGRFFTSWATRETHYIPLLLLSRFSRVWLCVTPETAAHLSLGFCRQEHWSGLPFRSPMHESEKWKWTCSVMSDS